MFIFQLNAVEEEILKQIIEIEGNQQLPDKRTILSVLHEIVANSASQDCIEIKFLVEKLQKIDDSELLSYIELVR